MIPIVTVTTKGCVRHDCQLHRCTTTKTLTSFFHSVVSFSTSRTPEVVIGFGQFLCHETRLNFTFAHEIQWHVYSIGGTTLKSEVYGVSNCAIATIQAPMYKQEVWDALLKSLTSMASHVTRNGPFSLILVYYAQLILVIYFQQSPVKNCV